MTRRIITGVCLTALLVFAVVMLGWVFALLFTAFIFLCVYEIFKGLSGAGHRPVQWPVWLCMAVSIPLLLKFESGRVVLPMIVGACALISAVVMFRNNPRLEDLLVSVMPLCAVVLPGMCVLGFLTEPSLPLQRLLILIAFGVPLMGDTMAYFVGSRIGKTALCPAVSPKKSVEGAVAGLAGSVLFALLLRLCFSAYCALPWWHFIVLGLLCGVAGQLGDLFASLVKRHCGVKDFGSLFPGHGGAMDRLDSVYWSAVIVYIYFLWVL